ncbi:MAG TPA: hypothetical protein VJ951_09600 [Bacteroidales bacterium]|nr:hypothetical protein [Bacteroidales bacterium]
MKNIFKTGMFAVLAIILVTACEPQVIDEYELGVAPTADQLSFTMTQDADDEFKYVFENTTSIVGVPSWNLGGTKKTGEKVSQRFPLPGEYEITLTYATQGGAASISKTVTTDKTDYAFLESEELSMISGGVDAIDGKTWVLDSLSAGHLGVGPVGSAGLDWWSAAPLAKQPVGVLYDDKMTFKLVGFDFIYENHGESYVKDFRADNPAYSNGEQRDTDYKVDFTPAEASWSLADEDGTWILSLIPTTSPIFPIFDVGAVNNRYEVLTLEENKLELVALEGGDGNAWHYSFIPEGYVKPEVEFETFVNATANTNEFEAGIENVNIPDGITVNKVVVDFGNGTVKETTDLNQTLTETYMRASPYSITISVVASNETLTSSVTVNVESNHPDYVPFLIDEMVVYNDFSEVMTFDVKGQDASVTVVGNPENIYPNKSTMVSMYSKTDQQWANAYMQLPAGYRFDLRSIATFKIMVYGKAGDVVLLKLENTDMGGNAWQTGVELTYTIKEDNTWEVAEYQFEGASTADLSWDPNLVPLMASDVTADDRYNHDYYDVVRIMLNPGVGEGTHEFYFDELSGPHVEGIKSAQF